MQCRFYFPDRGPYATFLGGGRGGRFSQRKRTLIIYTMLFLFCMSAVGSGSSVKLFCMDRVWHQLRAEDGVQQTVTSAAEGPLQTLHRLLSTQPCGDKREIDVCCSQ